MHELNEQILNEQISLAAHLIEHSAVPKNFATRRIFNEFCQEYWMNLRLYLHPE